MKKREDEKISFYTFPRDVYTNNCLVQKRKLYANGMQIHNTSNGTAVILNDYFI